MTSDIKFKYSVIVPAYNEAESIEKLHQDIVSVMNSLNEPYEIIFIDDGSKDSTFKKMQSLSPLKIIKFRGNYGQTAGLDAGIKQACGEILITLDSDGQNPPYEIPKLISKMKEGWDVVSGWRHKRKDSFLKKFVSRGANALRKILINDHIHDSGCTLKAFKKECFNGLDLFGEIHRFIPAILIWKGFKVAEVRVDHLPRMKGKTKYNWKRILKGFIDMLSVWFWRKYSNRPLHLFGGVGILFGLLGTVLGLYLAVARILKLISLQRSIWPLVSIFLILAGIQLFISGLLADIAIKNYYKGNRLTVYNIEKIVVNDSKDKKLTA